MRVVPPLGDAVVGPAPWYWKSFPSFEGHSWRFVPRRPGSEAPDGEPALFVDGRSSNDDERTEPVLIVRIYGRALRANDGHLLLWAPRQKEGDILIETYALSDLRQLQRDGADVADRPWRASAVPSGQVMIPQALTGGRAPGRFHLPTASTIPEILLLAEGPSPERAATSIYLWRPADGTIDVLPQTWFTSEANDLGYEWITRVTRDAVTGHFVGDGVRIAPFELDSDGNWLRALPSP